MRLTNNEINQILNTLPIGYYIKRNISISLDETAVTSYYDPMHDTIGISAPQLIDSIAQLSENDLNAENDIRTVLYHEVSHAFITPKNLTPTWERNVIEDERIESILRNYYKRVNFRNFVKRINHFKGEPPKDANDAFYQLVRYRIGNEAWLKSLHELILKYAEVNRISDSWTVCCYRDEIDKFYKDFCNWYNSLAKVEPEESKEKEDIGEGESEKTEINNHSNEPKESKESEEVEELEELEESEGNEWEGNEPDKNEQGEFNPENAENLINTVLNEYSDQDLLGNIQSILSRISNSAKNNGSAINAYSGRFDPRSVTRNDYKYFVQQNRMGHIKAYSKTNLNLFIDTSGSFSSSQKTANKLLYALSLFEKQNPDFSFNVVSCSCGEKILPKTKREIKCGGGNRLDSEIHNIYHSLQAPNAVNLNIVMFDGDAFTSSWNKEEDKKNFRVFNNSRTVIISDPDNEKTINRYCKKAKRIITNNYVQELIHHTLDSLKVLSR